MRFINLGIENEEAAGALADPLNQPPVAGAAQQRLDTVERVRAAAARGLVGWFGPFVDHRQRKTEFRGDLLGTALLEHLAQNFM